MVRMDCEAIAWGLYQDRNPNRDGGGHDVMELQTDAANGYDAYAGEVQAESPVMRPRGPSPRGPTPETSGHLG